MATKMFEVQTQIFSALTDDTDLMKIVKGIYDYVPEDVKAPYVSFGNMISSSNDTKLDNGEILTITLDIWSTSKGRKEAITILTSIEEILETELTITDATNLSQKIKDRDVVEESYGLYHATLDIEIKLDWS